MKTSIFLTIALLHICVTTIHCAEHNAIRSPSEGTSRLTPEFIACAQQREHIRISYVHQVEETRERRRKDYACCGLGPLFSYTKLRKHMDEVTPEYLRREFEARETCTQTCSYCIEETQITSIFALGELALTYPCFSMPFCCSVFEQEMYSLALIAALFASPIAELLTLANCSKSELEGIPGELLKQKDD